MNEWTPLFYQKTCTALSSGAWRLTCRSWSQSSHWSLLWISSRVRNLPGWLWAVSQWGLPSLGRPVARSPRRSAVWWCSSRCCPAHRSPLHHRRSSALPPPSWVTGQSHTRLTSTKELDFNFSACLTQLLGVFNHKRKTTLSTGSVQVLSAPSALCDHLFLWPEENLQSRAPPIKWFIHDILFSVQTPF